VPAAAAAGAAVLAGLAGFEGDANFHTHEAHTHTCVGRTGG